MLPRAAGDAVAARGVLAALAAALAFAAYTVAAKRLLVRGVPRLAAVAVPFLGAGLLLAPVLVAALRGADPGRVLAPEVLGVVAWLGLGATAVPYLLFTAGLRGVPAVTGATMALAEPLTATMLGVVLLGERLGPLRVVGAATVGIALLLAARRPDRDVGAAEPAAAGVPHPPRR